MRSREASRTTTSRVLFKLAFFCVFGPVYLTLASVGLRVLMPAVFVRTRDVPDAFASAQAIARSVE